MICVNGDIKLVWRGKNLSTDTARKLDMENTLLKKQRGNKMKKWGEMSHDEFTQAIAYAVVGYNNKLKETKYVRKKGVKK